MASTRWLTHIIFACAALAYHAVRGLESGYETITSNFSGYAIRVKSWSADDVHLCRGRAAHHTGWADIGHNHLFFWLHRVRSKKEDAPLLIWLQGGPGGSSLHGMLYENGPCLSDGSANDTQYNSYSWTEHFNVVYLDQPAGVGFSYVDDSANDEAYPSRAEFSSLDVVAFIKLLYEAFPELADVDLHIAGESYAGRYVPAIASAILEYNQFLTSAPVSKAAAAAAPTIPLRSLMLGNPWISPAEQLASMYDVSCFPYRDQFGPHLDERDCTRALKAVDRCEAVARACAAGDNDPVLCAQPKKLCQDEFVGIFANVTRSYYDRRRRHCPGPQDCYPDIAKMVDFLSSDRVMRELLEVPRQTGGRKSKWEMSSQLVEERYFESGDFYTPAIKDLERVLHYARAVRTTDYQRKLDVLVYVGVADIICNADGVLDGLRQIKWADRTLFRATPWRELPWTSSSGGRGGRLKSVPNLWLAEIEEAGHMVPLDQPASSLKLIEHWLSYIESAALSCGGVGLSETLDVGEEDYGRSQSKQYAFSIVKDQDAKAAAAA
ncbi:Carboxypeptidase Y-like protein [Colletotrichum orbiculare MAFF 240422]|uniref:Carboxypeptidase n=1 Tax=Colletotrichum orbiculare (strain 104-T / ATCC 96160 / CBS 514.97 / LARS 414 / MAFF 240422) TaxID=1213857 RepID=N4UZ03_COLOR|nr:Carboxypeptidase Y-like protein [Colletotrichum orbiculare MAFF 240422]